MRMLALLAVASLHGAEWRTVTDASGAPVELDLTSTWATDADLAKIGRMSGLRRLDLSETKITDAGMERLRALANVEELSCYYAEYLTEDGIAPIAGWPKLKRLNLRGTKVTSRVFDHLAKMAALEWLDLGFTQIEDDGMEALAGLANLRHLAIGGNRLSGAGLEVLKLLPHLESLDVGGIQRVDSGLWGLALTPANVARIGRLTGLRRLSLNGATISDRGVDKPGHPDAERKELRDLKGLEPLVQLEYLDLSRQPVTAEALESVRKLPRLRELRLALTPSTATIR